MCPKEQRCSTRYVQQHCSPVGTGLFHVLRSTTLLKSAKLRSSPQRRQTLKTSTARTIQKITKITQTPPTQTMQNPPKTTKIAPWGRPPFFTFCRLVGCRSDDGVGCRFDGGRWDPPPKGGGSAPHRIDRRPHHRIDSRRDDKRRNGWYWMRIRWSGLVFPGRGLCRPDDKT